MGLDMYLLAERPAPGVVPGVIEDGGTYISGWDHAEPEQQEAYRLLLKTTGLPGTDRAPSAYVLPGDPPLAQVHVAYWRKANAVHGWFVRECQGGVDECQVSESISREKLLELRKLCAEAIEHSSFVDELSPVSGFFFGNTDDLDYYLEDAKDTVEQIDKLLAACPEDTTFRYRSSW